jgi:hypothetical protein
MYANVIFQVNLMSCNFLNLLLSSTSFLVESEGAFYKILLFANKKQLKNFISLSDSFYFFSLAIWIRLSVLYCMEVAGVDILRPLNIFILCELILWLLIMSDASISNEILKINNEV